MILETSFSHKTDSFSFHNLAFMFFLFYSQPLTTSTLMFSGFCLHRNLAFSSVSVLFCLHTFPNIFFILFCVAIIISLASLPPYWNDILLLIFTDPSESPCVHIVMFLSFLTSKKDLSVSSQHNCLLYQSLMGQILKMLYGH